MNDPTFEEMVELVRELYIDDAPTSPAESLRDFYLSTVGELRADLLAGLIERSEDSKLEWDAVALIAQQALRSGERLPQALADWVADVLAGDLPRPTTGAQSTAYRDFRWRLAIRHLQNAFGLAPTRNATSDADCGCDVVAEAAREVQDRRSRVERTGRVLPPVLTDFGFRQDAPSWERVRRYGHALECPAS